MRKVGSWGFGEAYFQVFDMKNNKPFTINTYPPALFQKATRDVLTEEQLKQPLGDLVKTLCQSVGVNYYNGFTIEHMYRFLCSHPKIKKVSIVNENGGVSILISKEHDSEKNSSDCLGSCLAKAFKPYVNEARQELENSSFAQLMNNMNHGDA